MFDEKRKKVIWFVILIMVVWIDFWFPTEPEWNCCIWLFLKTENGLKQNLHKNGQNAGDVIINSCKCNDNFVDSFFVVETSL